uniref:ATP5E synthase n=1 Tax=Bubo bubo TaxID=30461 RepID=A0A8C0IE57_BUBBB
ASLPRASAELLRLYIRYSQICAQVVRAAMKPQYKAEAERAAMATVKTVKPKKE